MIAKVPAISEAERTPLVVALLEVIHQQAEAIAALRDEIARLKGEKPRPTIRPSTLEQPAPGAAPAPGRRPGSAKRPKTAQLVLHHTERIAPAALPAGARLKDYQDYVVQDLHLAAHNTCYRLERWQAATGECLVGELPAAVRAGGHFGPGLRGFVLYQHHHQQVTQPRLLAQLRDWGIDISSGQLSRLLTEGHDAFHAEKDRLLPAGLAVSAYVHADDTTARHRGQNGFCTHLGNEFFASFASTDAKSRINFLELLRGAATDYVLAAESYGYLQAQKLAAHLVQRLRQHPARRFAGRAEWERHLDALGIGCARHRRIATEGALLGSVLAQGVRPDLVVVSDDAGQFDVLVHALCWVHAERGINQLTPFSELQRVAVEAVRADLWQLYADLKAYKAAPDPGRKGDLAARFDALCGRRTCFATLDQVLKRLAQNKAELLVVLDRPEVPLHNNLSERDIREYVTKRKVSGGTRSELGRRCRDTFLSLKKTCQKLGVSFWHYLRDRLGELQAIPPLAELIHQKALASG